MKFRIASAPFTGGPTTALLFTVFPIQPVAQRAPNSEMTLTGKNAFLVPNPINGARHSSNSWVEINGGAQ
jgi:hypothetical protein